MALVMLPTLVHVPLWVTLMLFLILPCVVAPQPLVRRGKRLTAAFVLALVLASGLIAFAADDEFVVYDACKLYTSSDWQYWAFSCWL